MANNFDRIAQLYDPLAKLVFGKSIQQAQTEFLHLIPSNARVLIIGGGTGWIIPYIFSNSAVCQLVYVDNSAKMIELAKKNIDTAYISKVLFIKGTLDNLGNVEPFDAVLTFFFLDLFTEQNQLQLLSKLNSKIKKGGLWLNSDFEPALKIWWQHYLMALIFVFFRLVCKTESTHLNETAHLFGKIGWNCAVQKHFFKQMIFAKAYRHKEFVS